MGNNSSHPKDESHVKKSTLSQLFTPRSRNASTMKKVQDHLSIALPQETRGFLSVVEMFKQYFGNPIHLFNSSTFSPTVMSATFKHCFKGLISKDGVEMAAMIEFRDDDMSKRFV